MVAIASHLNVGSKGFEKRQTSQGGVLGNESLLSNEDGWPLAEWWKTVKFGFESEVCRGDLTIDRNNDSATQQKLMDVGFRTSTQPTFF